VRFTDVGVRPYNDGRRVKLSFKMTPFQERPSVEATVTNGDGLAVATMNLIEAMETDFDFTLHLRGPVPSGKHRIELMLFYIVSDDHPDQRQIVDERMVEFEIV
jgi:hypothetical protein